MNVSQTMTNEQAARLYGYEVDDSSGNKVGDVDGVWVDDATGKLEFIAVKTGWLFGKNHAMPAEQAQINDDNQTIQVPYSSDQIKNGPSFSSDAELTDDDEQQIYDYYGVQRSTQTSPTGYAAGGTGNIGAQSTGATDQLTGEQGEMVVPIVEEQVKVGKRQVTGEEQGSLRLRKVVRTEHEEIPVQLTREEVDIERVPADQLGNVQVPENAFQERTIDIPVTEEEPVVEKEQVVSRGIRIDKEPETVTQTIGADVRKEEVEFEQEGDIDVENDLNQQPS